MRSSIFAPCHLKSHLQFWIVKFVLVLFTLLGPGWLLAQTCSIPGNAGVRTTAAGETEINAYFAGTGSPSAGATSIAVAAGVGPTGAGIQPGDLLLIIQMQGSDINTSTATTAYGSGSASAITQTVAFGQTGYAGGVNGTNNFAGTYEWAVATNALALGAAGTINLSAGLANAYFTRAGSSTQGKQAFQVIRVPQYANLTLGVGLTVRAWDGAIGGVVVLEATGTLNLGGQTIDGVGRGFRGGGAINRTQQFTSGGGTAASQQYASLSALQFGGSKGEGIVGTPGRTYDGDFTGGGTGTLSLTAASVTDGIVGGDDSRGAPGNAGGGGNQHNAGGGGGGNGGAGGQGGNSWNSSTNAFSGQQVGGFGGSPSGNSQTRWIMGGGGGAGDIGGNTTTNPDGSGGAGGALVILRASQVVGGGATINVNGVAGQRSRATDAAGGGGAGGTVVVAAGSGGLSGALTVNGNGGAGGAYQAVGLEQDGPGGGGGGGALITSASVSGITLNAAGAAAGTSATTSGCAPSNCFAAAGITISAATAYGLAASPGLQVGYECLPNLTVSKATSTPLISSATGATASYTINISNSGGGARFVSVRDWTLPPGWTRAATAPTYIFSPVQPLAADQLSSGGEATAIAHTATWAANANPLVAPTAGSNSLTWDHFAIAPIKNGVPGSVTVSFVVSIPDTATVGTYQNGAGVTFLDPTRAAASTRTIAPLINNTNNRTSTAYNANTAYANFAGAGTTTVAGAQYSGLPAGPSAEDVTLLADIRLTKNTTTASVVSGRTTNFVLSAINTGRPLGSMTFTTDQATTVSGTVTAGNPMNFIDNFPTGLSLASAPATSNANWSCTGGAGSATFTCSAAASLYPVASGATMISVTATVNVAPSACPGGSIVNTATLSVAPIGESNTANNTAAAGLPILCTTNLSITKDNGTTTLTAGQTTTYTVTISVAAGATIASADGAIARDTPSVGLSNCTVTSCTPTGSPVATCPLAANWPNFLNGVGLPIPGLPAGSSVALTVQCGVTATGLP